MISHYTAKFYKHPINILFLIIFYLKGRGLGEAPGALSGHIGPFIHVCMDMYDISVAFPKVSF